MIWYEELPFAVSVDTIPDETNRNEATIYGNGFYFGTSPKNPDIGDLKVTFQEVPEQKISIVAKQVGSSLSSYTAHSGGTVLLVEAGAHDAAEMFQHANQALGLQTWACRLFGFLFIFAGFRVLMAPLCVLADVIPCIGNMFEAGFIYVSFLLAGLISSVTIAISWLAYRPVISMGSFALVFGLVYAIRHQRRMKQSTTTPIAESYELPLMDQWDHKYGPV
jgi:hypothetical protein